MVLTCYCIWGLIQWPLKGQGFDILVTENQKVTTDTQLANIDLTFLASEGKDDSIMVVFPENLNGEVNVKKVITL